jgi:hypothetical protein
MAENQPKSSQVIPVIVVAIISIAQQVAIAGPDQFDGPSFSRVIVKIPCLLNSLRNPSSNLISSQDTFVSPNQTSTSSRRKTTIAMKARPGGRQNNCEWKQKDRLHIKDQK